MLIFTMMMVAGAAEFDNLRVGYYTPYGVQPGIAISTQMPLKEKLFIRPQITNFYRANNHISGMIGVDVGQSFSKNKNTHSISFGAGYQMAAQITSWSIDLGSGEREATRELRHYVLPAFSYEYARPTWYLRSSFGPRFSPQVGRSGFLALEVGGIFALGGEK